MSRQGGFRGLAVAVTLGAVCLGATGCADLVTTPRPTGTVPPSSASAPSSPSSAAGVVSSATTTSAAATPSRKPATAAATLPPGYRWRTVEKVHTTFAAPKTWTALDPAALGDLAAGSPALKEMADRMGLTVDQLVQFLDHVDLFLAGPAVRGYAPNIQAAVLPMLELPDEAAVSLEIGRVASSKPQLRHARTPLGDAMDVAYRIRVAGRTVYVHSVLMETGDGVLDLTVGATSEDLAASVSRTLVKTVHRS